MFTFPNFRFEADCSNERSVTLCLGEGINTFGVDFKFDNSVLQKQGIDGIIEVPYRTEEEIDSFSTRRKLPSHEMLVDLLIRLNTNWMRFLRNHLSVEIRQLKDFIHKDIKSSLPPRVLTWSEEIQRNLKRETDSRDIPEISTPERILPVMLESYQTTRDLWIAKSVILDILKDAGIISSDHVDHEKSLTLDSQEVLASALMYVPVKTLKDTIRDSFEKSKMFSPSQEIEEFMYSGKLPEGTTPHEEVPR